MTGLFNNPRRHLRKLVKQKKYDEALEYGHGIEKKLEHDPDIAFIIGTIYYIKGDSEKTIEYMNSVLEIGEFDLDALAIKARGVILILSPDTGSVNFALKSSSSVISISS